MRTRTHESTVEEAKRDGIRRYGVCAIISIDEKVLLVHRRKDDFLGGIYEFPGGAVETNERLIDAISREVKEETGLKVSKIRKYIGFFDYESENGERTRVFNFHVEVRKPLRIRLTEHDRFVWADEAKLARLGLTGTILNVLELFRQESQRNPTKRKPVIS